ncbi:beta-glucuronosyltransferase GlcAT14A [Heracleum sosnowskyi]|uniref:Beta-glucuronosyltransferase GlcAT14A n=1 Tax=Heracleum sosnowskyi TaxID=360622 RepID=A0AAD8NE94_9APIA|nr:beta-glucuronosyltransferase GlcAT14A [Heracleum sosnowskyi]
MVSSKFPATSVRGYLISFFLTALTFSLFYVPTLLKTFNNVTNLASPKSLVIPEPSYPVRFAYLISASKGDVVKLRRTVLALYHPGNYYLIHLDNEASETEQSQIAEFVASYEVFRQMGNIWVVDKPNLVTYRGPTMLSATLHALSILLRRADEWDWFINLSASDYPLVTQDDLIHAFSDLPRDLNFVQHSSNLGWKVNKRAKPIMIDPGLYSLNKSDILWANKQRTVPTAFKLYTGSAWTMLSRSFAEYCIMGWENLPRTLLLYYTNFVSSPEGYFQTVICNSEEYKNTTVNHDLHYIAWDNPPKQHPRLLGLRDYQKMILSHRPFARKFKQDHRVLDKIDRYLLNRQNGEFTYGGWCFKRENITENCSGLQAEKYGVLRPGTGARRLRSLLRKTLYIDDFEIRQCK